MPRKNRMPGAHFEWDFLNGPRVRSMSPVEWTLYSKLWALATHDRRKIVCRMRYDCTYLAEFMHIDRRTLSKLITDLEQKCCKNAHLAALLDVTEHYIKVNGVQEKQDWLTWKEPLACCSLNVPSRSTSTCTKTKTKTKTKDEGGTSMGELDNFLTTWNQAGLENARKLTASRMKHLRARLKDDDWRNNWKQALSRLQKSRFAKGFNDRGFVANIDFFLRPDTVTKVLEGKYDGKKKDEGDGGLAAAWGVDDGH